MIGQVIVTVLLSVFLTLAVGAAIAGLLSDDSRSEKVGGVGLCAAIAIGCIMGIIAAWT